MTAELLMYITFAPFILKIFLVSLMCWSLCQPLFCLHLRCNPQALENALCKRVMITREEVITKTLDPLGATVSRDGLAKTIYSRLFDW